MLRVELRDVRSLMFFFFFFFFLKYLALVPIRENPPGASQKNYDFDFQKKKIQIFIYCKLRLGEWAYVRPIDVIMLDRLFSFSGTV